MTLDAALQLSLFSISAVLVALGGAIAIRRVSRNYHDEEYRRREAEFRPMLMRCLSEDMPDLSPLDSVTGRDSKYVQSLVWNMLTKVRGGSREALVAWLDERRLVERERARTYDHSSVRRAVSAERLGNAGVATTARAVIRLLDDRDPEVRIVAARALGKMGNAGAVGPLLDTLDGKHDVPLSIVTMALLHIGPSVVEPLVPFLGSESPNVRGVCAEILGMHGAMPATKWLTLLVTHDPEMDVRVRAANALGRIGAPSGIEVLVRSASSDNPVRLRSAAVLALGQIGGKQALGALQVAINDDDEQVSSIAAEALAGLNQQGIDILNLVSESGGPGQKRASDWLTRVQLESGTRRVRRVGASL